jgi:hypothetical protein
MTHVPVGASMARSNTQNPDAEEPDMAKTQRLFQLSPEKLEELLKLTKGADSVELKLTVPDSARWSTVTALDMDPLDAQMRQVYFFDTPDLALNAAGLVVRARRVQVRGDDTVVKLRPVTPDELPSELRKSRNMVVEVDAMPGGYVCSASLKGALATPLVKDVVGGRKPIRKLYSKEQRAFFAAHAPNGITLDELSILGPISVLKLKFRPDGLHRRIVAEMWFYPDGSRILELSAKCSPAEAFQVAAELRAFIGTRGVDLTGEQQTKTKTALEFFSSAAEPATTGAT